MPHRCPLCRTAGATCGPKTTEILPVDARVTGVKVAGDRLVPTVPAPSEDMTDEEKEDYQTLVAALTKKSLRQQLEERRIQAMAEGTVAHTYLVYVDRGDGILTKMDSDTAEKYVELNPGSSIVRRGAAPQPPAEGAEPIGATKATLGEMFDASGRQKEDVQPLTTRTFNATDRARDDALKPAVGTHGTASTERMTGTGNMTSSAVPATSETTQTTDTRSPRIQRPSATKPADDTTPPASNTTTAGKPNDGDNS